MSQTSAARPSNFGLPINAGMIRPQLSQTNPAKWTHRQFVECIYDFEKSLDDDHEVGARMISFASEVTFYIQDVRYYDPHMVSFCGSKENGEKFQLIQNVSQLSICLISILIYGLPPVCKGFAMNASDKFAAIYPASF
jgi:hypothetical protein